MDRLSQLRDKAGGSRDLSDSTLDTTSAPSEAFLTANSSKYFSLSEVDSTFDLTLKNDVSPIKDVSLASTTAESEGTTATADELISNLSPIRKKSDNLDSFKIDTRIEAANILSGGVSIFDDNSYDGDELVIDDNVDVSEKSELKQPECLQFKEDHNIESNINEAMDIGSKDTEVVLQIDGNNVDAIDIGNGLYLYRKAGQEELAAVQIIDDDQQPSFKFLKVRENAEGNLEVYEEIEIEVPKEVPIKDEKVIDKNISSHVPIKDINKVISDSSCTKVTDRKIKSPQKEIASKAEVDTENKEISLDSKSEVNLNGKMVKFSESRKMTYHSTPNKEGIPLTKIMVDQHLPTNRHSDISNVKKTIEVHTDNCKHKSTETNKSKDIDENKVNDLSNTEKEVISLEALNKDLYSKKENNDDIGIKSNKSVDINVLDDTLIPRTIEKNKNISMKLNDIIDSTNKNITIATAKDNLMEDVDNKDLVIDEEIKIEENIKIGDSENSKNENLVQTVSNEKQSDEHTVQVANVEEKKDKQDIKDMELTKYKFVPTERNGEKTANKVEQNEIKKDQKPVQLQNVTLKNNKETESVESKEKKRYTKESEINNSGKIESKDNISNIGIIGDECKVVPMDIDYAIGSSIIASCAEKSKAEVELCIQSCNKESKKEVEPIANQSLNDPIIIDDDDVSIVEISVDSKDNQEKPKQDLLMLNSSKAKMASNKQNNIDMPLQKIPKVLEGTKKIEDIATENKNKQICEKPQNSPSVTNIVNQPEVKKYIISTSHCPTSSEQNIRKGNTTFDKIKESKINSISKDISQLNEPVQITSLLSIESGKKSSDNVPQQKSNVKSFINMPEAQLSTNKKYNKKPMANVPIKDPVSAEVSKYMPINKSVFQTQSGMYSKDTAVISNLLETTDKAVLSKPKKNDNNILYMQPRKDNTSTVQVTKTQPIEVNKCVNLSIAPISKDGQQSEMCNLKEKNMSGTIIGLNTPQTCDVRPPSTSQKDDKKEVKIPAKSVTNEKGRSVMNIEICKVPKLQPPKTNITAKQDNSSSSKNVSQSLKNVIDVKEKKVPDPKPINNNNAAVPFGKWTEANRQEFLSKFKTKTLVVSSNSNQLKNSNDLNRRDVLKKIDKQRQSSNILSKPLDTNRVVSKPEMAAFSNKSNIITKEIHKQSDNKHTQNHEILNFKSVPQKNVLKIEAVPKPHSEPAHKISSTSVTKNEACQRTGVVQNLIDKTIEGMIHRNAPALKLPDETKQDLTKESSTSLSVKPKQPYQPIEQATLDEIEMKMNELHGIPFIERPPHELPQVIYTAPEAKTSSKVEQKPSVSSKTIIPNLLPFINKNQMKDGLKGVMDVDSEDEIIEHEPITGDIDVNKKCGEIKFSVKDALSSNIKEMQQDNPKLKVDTGKKEAIITEKDFDKFVRRNSITYENRITVNFDGKEPHNVIQTVVGKDSNAKNYSKTDHGPKAKHQNYQTNTEINKNQPINKLVTEQDDASSRNQSKLQKAYQSVLTAKRQMAAESPITIIEDKPVKVVFMDNVDYFSNQLNIEGQNLSPAKKALPESDFTVTTGEPLDSDVLDSADDSKLQDEMKSKTKHVRKQVLTPVDEPELELIEPSDLGIEVSPKKKRKTDEDNRDKSLKYPMRKKFYLLGSTTTEEKVAEPVERMKNSSKESVKTNENEHQNSVSALDSLVKAAELIETQTDINKSIETKPDSQSNTPVKRGRGRPRKYPLTPDGVADKSKIKTSPQKRPRLIDSKVPKRYISLDESDSEEDIIIKENWTMGKINENIVCPICNKLFRTENVVFKHVKHCTGPSPSRSDSDKRSLSKMRISQDFDTKSVDSKSDDMDIDDDKPLIVTKENLKKHSSKLSKKADDKDNIVEINTHTKEKPQKVITRKHSENNESKIPQKNIALVCEFCGCKFRQLSYLTKHILLQHKNTEKTDTKTNEKDVPITTNSVYSCEICKKEFRKLHHLVQHRIIHNPSSLPAKSLRKSSSEHSENKIVKDLSPPKQEDLSAGFRCEPCDKSFRKLHHLVEHRETHDGINRQKTSSLLGSKEEKPVEKSVILHQCEVCKKTFKKLQQLNEHKEQHLETSSEKSDDKSVQSSLSTRDIIHECSLCYMVFPNEHSLNKHTVNCQRKKRQSKLQKPVDETETADEVAESPLPDKEVEYIDSPKDLVEENIESSEKHVTASVVEPPEAVSVANELGMSNEKIEEHIEDKKEEKFVETVEEKVIVEQAPAAKRDFLKTSICKTEVPEKIKKVEEKASVTVLETPKKKTPVKDKIGSASKRLKTANTLAQNIQETVTVESSDDDDVRYMLNPNFKADDMTEEKVFMKVRANKRNSLQIDRPNSKELVKRRISLQHPPKIPRLRSKAAEATASVKKEIQPKLELVPSTDSDDSETTKYSFPVTSEKCTKPIQNRVSKDSERKTQRKSLGDKRKSITGIAKRKSLGKVTAKHKATLLQQVKKRKIDVEHRCDCGQLFSSAALLSRHTTLAHTPPRIRRRRSPPPDDKPIEKPAQRKSITAMKHKLTSAPKKSSVASSPKSTKTETKSIKKSIDKNIKSSSNTKKVKAETSSSIQPRRSVPNRSVPLPSKIRKSRAEK